jgi:hypothetical protein
MQRSSRKYLLAPAPHVDQIPANLKTEAFEVDKVYMKAKTLSRIRL